MAGHSGSGLGTWHFAVRVCRNSLMSNVAEVVAQTFAVYLVFGHGEESEKGERGLGA